MAGIQDLYRVGAKFYFKSVEGLDLGAAAGVFHGWIQQGLVPGLLIDVADYRHVEDGPSVLLIAHEGNYALALEGSTPSFEYYAKRPGGPDLAGRWRTACRNALAGARLLCSESALGVSLEFDSSRVDLLTRDRLRAPAGEKSTGRDLLGVLDGLLAELYGEPPERRILEEKPSKLFSVRVEGAPIVEPAVLLAALDR